MLYRLKNTEFRMPNTDNGTVGIFQGQNYMFQKSNTELIYCTRIQGIPFAKGMAIVFSFGKFTNHKQLRVCIFLTCIAKQGDDRKTAKK